LRVVGVWRDGRVEAMTKHHVAREFPREASNGRAPSPKRRVLQRVQNCRQGAGRPGSDVTDREENEGVPLRSVRLRLFFFIKRQIGM